MNSIHITIPDHHQHILEEEIHKLDYNSVEDYVIDLIDKDLSGRAEEQLENLLQEGFNDPVDINVDKEWWIRKREELHQ